MNEKSEDNGQDEASHQEMLARLDRAELVASLRQAAAQINEGKGISLESLEAELTELYGA